MTEADSPRRRGPGKKQKPLVLCGLCGVVITDRPRGKFCSRACYHRASRQPATQATVERWSIPEPNSGCWLWLGALTGSGYGILSTGRKLQVASRLSYAVFKGDPHGQVVRHTCDNPACVSPEHLMLGTSADNSADAVQRDRMERGSKRWCAVLSEADIPDIRRRLALGEMQFSIAALYGVDRSTISAIKRGRSWRREL